MTALAAAPAWRGGWAQGLAYGGLGLPLAFVALPLYVVLPNHYAAEFGIPLATLGALLLVYSVYMLSQVRLPSLVLSPRAGLWGDAAVGLVGGFLGGLAGLSGFVPTIWCALRGGDKTSNRALMQAYILLTGVLGLVWVGGLVGIDAQTQQRLWFGLPFVVVGGALGMWLFSRLDTARFNRLVLWLLAACGAILVLRA